MGKYLQVARQALMDSISDPSGSILWVGVAIMELVVPMLVWYSATSPGGSFSGFSKTQILVYYALMSVVGAITFSATHFDMAFQIRNGDVLHSLVKPVSFLTLNAAHGLGDKLFTLLIRLPLFAFVLFFASSTIHLTVWAILATFSGLLIYLLISLCFGLISFWTTEISGYVGAFFFFNYLLSGEIAPISFFPNWLKNIATALPYRYTLSFPIELLLNKLQTNQIIFGFIIQIVWIIGLIVLLKFLWRKALIKYQAYGK